MSFVKFLAKESRYLYDTDTRSVLTWVYDLFEKVEESKRPRDLRPILKSHPGCDGYYYTSLNMALLGRNHQIMGTPTHCRDYLNEIIRHYVTGKTYSYHVNVDWPGELDKDSLKIVLFLDRPVAIKIDPALNIQPLDGIRNGIRVANMYGSVAGWRKIRVVRCLMYNGEDQREVYVLVGCNDWFRTPQFISLLLLLIRICLAHEVPKWIKDAYSLQGYWHELLHYNMPNGSDFSDFLYKSYDWLLTLVANEREIFPDEMCHNYRPGLSEFHPKSGLAHLISGGGTDREATAKLTQLYTEVTENAGRES